VFYSCGGDDNKTQPIKGDNNTNQVLKTGVLLDSLVGGIKYKTASQSGITNSNGEFSYLEGESVTFSVGDIDFPDAIAAPELTPLDLAGSTDVKNSSVINIARLLQTLDTDGDLSNGITIGEIAHATASGMTVSFDSPTFENDVANIVANSGSVNTSLVDGTTAIHHLRQSIDSDADGVSDARDNCPNISNTDQRDENGNRIGDACELVQVDTDLDGLTNDVDNCPFTPNPAQFDTDNDGIGNVCDQTPAG